MAESFARGTRGARHQAVYQRAGAATGFTVGLLTAAGFADVLELRRERKFELYGLGIRMPEPLVPAERRLEVEERTDAGGAAALGGRPTCR
jgi:N-methylhydantoinase A